MRDCQQSQTLDILILLYILYLSTAANHKYKTAIKQHKVIGTNWAHERSRRVPEIFAATAALKHQAAAPQAPRRLQDLGLEEAGDRHSSCLQHPIPPACNAFLSFYQL